MVILATIIAGITLRRVLIGAAAATGATYVAGEAADKMTKAALVGGGLYLAYKVMK